MNAELDKWTFTGRYVERVVKHFTELPRTKGRATFVPPTTCLENLLGTCGRRELWHILTSCIVFPAVYSMLFFADMGLAKRTATEVTIAPIFLRVSNI